MHLRLTVLASAFALTIAIAAVPQTAWAQTAEQQAACQNDAMTLCSHAVPDHGRIASCLRSRWRYVSRACRAQFVKARKRGRRRN